MMSRTPAIDSDPLQPLTPARTFALSVEDLWGLMWRGDGAALWLQGAAIDPTDGGTGSLRGWNGGAPATVRIDIDRLTGRRALVLDAGGGVALRIELHGGRARAVVALVGRVASAAEDLAERWSDSMDRLAVMVAAVVRRRAQPRQAVVVIHGVGQQQPGTTISAFIAGGVLGRDVDDAVRVRPDPMSHLFDLRRWSFRPTDDLSSPRTDAYELYWADLMVGGTVGRTLSWVRRLLLRVDVPYPLRPAWTVAWLAIAAVVLGLLGLVLRFGGLPPWLASGSALVVVGLAIWRTVLAPTVTGYLGDAARYLSPDLEDVPVRQRIRENGVRLLDDLHASGRYDRIVIVGHSLGSVIAYDMLTFAWPRYGTADQRPESPRSADIRRMERRAVIDADRDGPDDADLGQRLQHRAWAEAQRNTQPWLVTDLVTLGNPMTYDGYLMAQGTKQQTATAMQDEARRRGILPTCPPAMTPVRERSTHAAPGERRCTFDRGYDAPADAVAPRAPTGLPFARAKTVTLFAAGAPFGVTRWTNLFFPVTRGGLSGDVIGGPVAPAFGRWIRDVAVVPPVRGFAHGDYWLRVGTDPTTSNEHLAALQTAIGPDSYAELRRLLQEIPAHVIHDRVHREQSRAARTAF